jgi:D-3-phosphoglycerate dehydrogenase
MRDILVTENIAGAQMDALRGAFDVEYAPQLWQAPEKLREMIGQFRAIIVRNQTAVNADLLRAGTNLQVVARAGVGLDNVDVTMASTLGIVVVSTPSENALSVAELTIGLILSMARMIPAADRSAKAGKWERQRFTGVELSGKTLGIVGLGRIGVLTAQRARAFDMRIIAHDRFVKSDSPNVTQSGAALVSLDELIEQSDAITVHVPKTAETVGLFNYERFSRMKPSAMFVNTSRGEVVDEEGLIRALAEKKIAAAALDVRGKEPPEPGSPLKEMDNVILTPHIAAFTHEGQKRVVASVCRDVTAVLRGEDPQQFVNFPKPKRR